MDPSDRSLYSCCQIIGGYWGVTVQFTKHVEAVLRQINVDPAKYLEKNRSN